MATLQDERLARECALEVGVCSYFSYKQPGNDKTLYFVPLDQAGSLPLYQSPYVDVTSIKEIRI